jgi:alkylation response protein AidB-like acyl-CoA dehydrogenase
MDLELTEEQEALRDSVRDFLARECPVALARGVVERGDNTPVDGLWRRMVALDWPALTLPESVGGLGYGCVELAVVAEEMGRAIAPGPFVPTVGLFAPAVRAAGDAEQQKRFLGAVARGEITGTMAAGPGDVTARAAEGSGGAGWTLRGERRYVLGALDADELAVPVTLDGLPALVVVPASACEITAVTAFDRTRSVGTLTFADAAVAPERLLGTPGPATASAIDHALEEAAVAIAAETVGACQTIFTMALEYAKVREQFGVPIGSFQAIKHKLADMFVALERARTMTYFAALTIAEDDGRRALAVSMAKAAAGDCQRLVAQEAIQIHGGIGYTWEHDLHLFVKRAKAGDMLLGTAAEHRQRIADQLAL